MPAVPTILDELLSAGPCVLETDVLDGLRALPSNSLDAIVTDPPYGLEFMGAEWDSFNGEAWRAGAGMTAPGLGDRPNAWPSFGGDTANATCSRCKGRMRGKKVCECPEPAWVVKGQPRQLQDSTYQTGHYGRNTSVRHGIGASYGTEGAKTSRAFGEWCYQWAVEALRVAKPGAHILAFGGTRTSHRLVCALEDAGWEIRDEIMYLYGSGFPKSSDVSKAVDKALGKAAERAFKSVNPAQRPYNTEHGETTSGWKAPTRPDKTHPASPQAREFEGWGTALKPSYEPIVVARKPLIGTVARNVLRYRTGGLNIDACRLRTDWETDPTRRGWQGGRRPKTGAFDSGDTSEPTTPRETPLKGRWPGNVILGHTPDCVCAGTDGTETVETWECVEPIRLRVPLFAAGTMQPSGPSHEPEALPGLLRYALRGWSGCSTSGTAPSLGAVASDDTARIQSVASSGDPSCAVVRALGLSGLRGFQDGYRFSLRSDDELVRQVATAFQASPRQLFDVLCRVCSDLFAPTHTPESPRGARPSSSGGSPACKTQPSTGASKIAAQNPPPSASVETQARTAGTESPAKAVADARLGSTRESNTASPCGTTETECGSVRTESDEILLASWCLYVLSVASPDDVAHRWIDVNLGGCPVAELDAQSGARPSTLTGRADPAVAHPNGGSTEVTGFGGVGGGGGFVYADRGGASRFFYSVKANSNDRWVAISCSEGCAFHGAKMSRRAAKASATKPVKGARDGLCRSCGANRTHAGHPTVKPEGLMRYLVRLVTPPGGVVLDLFCGSGSTGVAAVKEGFQFLGIDKTPEYVQLSRARLADVLDKLSKNQPLVEEADLDEEELETELDEELEEALGEG